MFNILINQIFQRGGEIGMKNCIKKSLKASNGITLIALVVTIIVLLILARNQHYDVISETIGILTKAGQAKTLTDESQIREEIQLAWNGVQVDGVTKGWDNSTKANALNTELLKEDENASASWNTTDSVIDVTYKGYETTINPNTGAMTPLAKAGDTPITPNPPSSTVVKIGSTDISSVAGFDDSEGLKDYYGETTDFKSATTGDLATINWQLFYDDADNIYLITSDYIPSSLFPSGIIANSYKGTFADEYGELDEESWGYPGTIMTNTTWKDGANSSIFTNNAFSTKYLKWVTYAKSNSEYATGYAMRAVAYMMDSSIWNSFTGGVTGAIGYGGPTVEMFALSYNAGHPSSDQMGTYNSIITDDDNANANEYGYYVKIGNYDWSSGEQLYGEYASSDMWYINDDSKASYMWLASPASASNGDYGTQDGWLLNSYLNPEQVCDSDCGFRPVVSIPKSSLK